MFPKNDKKTMSSIYGINGSIYLNFNGWVIHALCYQTNYYCYDQTNVKRNLHQNHLLFISYNAIPVLQ